MIKIDRYTKVYDGETVRAKMQEHNTAVDVFEDAMKWLQEATADKLDKKATKAILTKWETEYASGHEEVRYLDNGYGWRIYMGDYQYRDEKAITIEVCKREDYSNGEPHLVPLKDFYNGSFSYPKGSTWREVWEHIDPYWKPKKYDYRYTDLIKISERLQALVDTVKNLESESNENYNNKNWYYEMFLEDR